MVNRDPSTDNPVGNGYYDTKVNNMEPKFRQAVKKSRKIPVIKHSQYESTEAVHTNKRYWKTVFEKLDLGVKEPPVEQQSSKIADALPPKLYHKVCEVLALKAKGHLNLDDEEDQNSKRSEWQPEVLVKEPKISSRKTIRIVREQDSDTDVEVEDEAAEEENIHLKLLRKPEREQITWPTKYLLPEREDEKSLVKRADDLTDKIAEEFCTYMKELGGNQQSQLFTPKTIKELFEVGFHTHAARSLKIVPRELPTVCEKIAEVTGNPEKSVYRVLQRELSKDIKAESMPKLIRGFGRDLPPKEQFIPPVNNTRELWRCSKHVPKDLVTLKTVWEGITNLRSVKEYCLWMIDHPEYRRPPYLKSLGMFDSAVMRARLSYDTQAPLSPQEHPNYDLSSRLSDNVK